MNIPSMLVTLDVSKFSGWLNADAFCQGSGLGLGFYRVRIVVFGSPRVRGLRCAAAEPTLAASELVIGLELVELSF